MPCLWQPLSLNPVIRMVQSKILCYLIHLSLLLSFTVFCSEDFHHFLLPGRGFIIFCCRERFHHFLLSGEVSSFSAVERGFIIFCYPSVSMVLRYCWQSSQRCTHWWWSLPGPCELYPNCTLSETLWSRLITWCWGRRVTPAEQNTQAPNISLIMIVSTNVYILYPWKICYNTNTNTNRFHTWSNSNPDFVRKKMKLKFVIVLK